MKARLGFVSNSSSSSWVVGHCPDGVKAVKLTPEQRMRVREYLLCDEYLDKERFEVLDRCPDWWLTKFISECTDADAALAVDSVPYMDGEMSEVPYYPDDLVELTGDKYGEDGVWIRRDHSPIHKVVKSAELGKLLEKTFHASEYVVVVKSDMAEVRPYEV